MPLPILFLIGILVGGFGTLIGAGGGFILVPLLAILQPELPTATLTAISLAVVMFNAGSGAIAYARQRRIDYRLGIPFAIATLPGSVIGSLLTHAFERRAFDLVLAILLIGLAALIELRSAREEPRPAPEGAGLGPPGETVVPHQPDLRLGVALSFVVGFVSSVLGIGGGVIHVPALIGLLAIPVHIATATSHFVLAIMATAGTATHALAGDLGSSIGQTLALGAGAVIGAQVGAVLSTRVHGKLIVRILAASLIFIGLRLAWQGLTGA